jgi:pimeloyl-ACP methyl ester carboxylesterase
MPPDDLTDEPGVPTPDAVPPVGPAPPAEVLPPPPEVDPAAPPLFQPFVPPAPPVSRATRGGATLRWIAFLIGVAGLAIGAIGIRSAAILSGRIDPDLVTTPELASFGMVALGIQAGLLALVAAAVVLGHRWSKRVAASLTRFGDPGPLLARARRTARLAFALGIGGALLLTIGALGVLVPLGRDVARGSWLVGAVGGFALPLSGALLIWLIGDIERREALAIHATDPWQPHPGERDRRWPIPAIALLAVFAIVPPAANIPYLWSDHVCYASDLECRWVIVQADQVANDPRGPTAVLHYGIRRATRESKGTLVIATGGPGVSGVSAYADSPEYDTRLTDSYDIVVFDARGVGESGYVDCPVASQRYQASLWFDAAPQVIEDFVDACVDEAGVDRARLADYGSANIAEDIETIRRDLGVDRIALYGESYGTVVAQRYAVAHPDHLEALILDGPIDIAQSTDASWVEATKGFEDVLRRSLGSCQSTEGCRFHDASVWSNVMKSVEGDTVSASYADTEGVVTDWPLTADAVRETLLNAMYDVGGRMLTLRALTAAEAGDWVPMARLVYSGMTDFVAYEAISDFTYYAASCADRHTAGSETDASQFMKDARSSSFATSRTGSVYLSSAACHAWPLPAAADPPVPVPATAGFPVLILTATGDPITPPAHGRRIFERYQEITDTYLIRTQDGPHVTFGRGWECPDDIVIDLLIADARPKAGTSCPGEMVSPFLELAVDRTGGDPIEFRARALDLELLAHPDYIGWDGVDRLVVGCRYGGRLEVTSEGSDEDFVDTITVDDCAIVKSEPLNGSGTYRGTDEAEFDVRWPAGEFTYRIVAEWRYTMDEEGTATWEGTFQGRSIEGRR